MDVPRRASPYRDTQAEILMTKRDSIMSNSEGKLMPQWEMSLTTSIYKDIKVAGARRTRRRKILDSVKGRSCKDF